MNENSHLMLQTKDLKIIWDYLSLKNENPFVFKNRVLFSSFYISQFRWIYSGLRNLFFYKKED